ncbi:MAG: hypothetical protein LBC64_07055 [Fibromonadaceae bacterium]|nr:hypothetical protein [Fibromonadaceae bacterium]
MAAIPIIPSLCLALTVQFLLWFNLLVPFNTLTEGFDRKLFFIFSLSGIFIAGISIVFYKVLSFDKTNKKAFIIGIAFQVLCILSCIFFLISSLTGRLLFV